MYLCGNIHVLVTSYVDDRENDWTFSSKQGREDLCASAGFQRLVVVTLHRQHKYDSMEQVKGVV